jgi:hypothetical protein
MSQKTIVSRLQVLTLPGRRGKQQTKNFGKVLLDFYRSVVDPASLKLDAHEALVIAS